MATSVASIAAPTTAANCLFCSHNDLNENHPPTSAPATALHRGESARPLPSSTSGSSLRGTCAVGLGGEPSRDQRVGPWSPLIPLKVGPFLAAGDNAPRGTMGVVLPTQGPQQPNSPVVWRTQPPALKPFPKQSWDTELWVWATAVSGDC